ncbi:MAG: DUF1893 domain-containing protein [Candidatus Thermoplasmatota archaeon]
MIDEHIINDMNLARNSILKSNNSVVVVKNGILLAKKSGNGLRPILELINEFEKDIQGSVIGDKILGKASALLCVYCGVKGVYSPQSTKSAIAILLKNSIPSQIDRIIPFIQNKDGNDICPFERMIENIESPIDAYKILKKIIMK